HPICDLQIEYSLVTRSIEDAILPTCRELGIGITAYGVLSRGLISGHWNGDTNPGDMRANYPRFAADNLSRNLALVDHIRALAEARAATVAQIAIAWVLSRGDAIVPLIGARRRDRLDEALGVQGLTLSPGEIATLDAAIPKDAVAGGRYAAAQLAHLDSERK
ncbi:MAG: aldo/keto reductase, partial [Paracoccaceae bacterium]|nr:aldo/keto reductase [Paracoccaceae bacterium]